MFNLSKRSSHNLRFMQPELAAKVVDSSVGIIYKSIKTFLDLDNEFAPMEEFVWGMNIKEEYQNKIHNIKGEILFYRGECECNNYASYSVDSNGGENIWVLGKKIINDYGINKENVDYAEDWIKVQVKSIMLHELTHAIDPKSTNKYYSQFSYNEMLEQETEFDAYSQSICFLISTYLKDDEDEKKRYEIFNWIQRGNLESCPDCIKYFRQIFALWDKNPILKRRFILRVYNELQIDKKNIFAENIRLTKKNGGIVFF